VTASNLVKVNMDEDLDEKDGVNRPGFTLHGGVLSARPDVNCAVHVHTNNGMAIAGLKHGLRMVSQQAIRFYQRIGYHAYEGITEDFAERERINKDLGKNRAMIMHNHGLLKLEAIGSELVEVPPDVCAKTAEQYEHHDSGRSSADWAAYLRVLDGIDTSYRE
jgi:ribulose-5-phosphate 4-epimerase/fuculose-1-phosphate aldolase